MLTGFRAVLFLLCLGSWVFVGCGQQRTVRGNYLGERSLNLVGDAAAQIVTLYPPAKTRIVVPVEPREDDLFGMGLVGKLREAGYAVHERHGRGDEPRGKGLLLTYVVDEFDDQARVLVHLGSDSLSRIYDVDGQTGSFVPAGSWAWRRGEVEK